MKKVKYLWFLIIQVAVISCMMSCEEDIKVQLNPDNFQPSQWLVPLKTSIVMEKAKADSVFTTLAWSATNFGYNASVSYAIQVAVKQAGKDPKDLNYITLATVTDTTYTVKVKDLNSTILTAGAVKRRPTDMIMRVEASISKAYPTITSTLSEFTATTFSNDPDMLYVIGDYSGWNINNSEVLYSPNWDGNYDGYVYIPTVNEGIRFVEEVNPEVKWGLPSNYTPGSATTVNLVSDGNIITKGTFKPSALAEEIFDGPGFYRMTVKITASTKTVIVYKFFKEFFVAGQRNMNYPNWSNSMSNQDPAVTTGVGIGALLTYNAADKVWVAKHIFVPGFQTDGAGVPSTAAFEFKFRANKGTSWGNAANLGGNMTNTALVDGTQKGTLNYGGGNLKMIAPQAYYDFYVYLQTYPLRYELVKSAQQ